MEPWILVTTFLSPWPLHCHLWSMKSENLYWKMYVSDIMQWNTVQWTNMVCSVKILTSSRPIIQVKPPCKWLSCTTWGGLIMVCQPMLSPWSTSSGRWGRSTHPSTSILSWSTVVLVWGGLVPLLCWIAWCRGSRLRGMWISMNSWKIWECSECWWCRLRYTLFTLAYPLYYFYDQLW